MSVLAEIWTILSKEKQQALLEMASLLAPELSEPKTNSSFKGNKRKKPNK